MTNAMKRRLAQWVWVVIGAWVMLPAAGWADIIPSRSLADRIATPPQELPPVPVPPAIMGLSTRDDRLLLAAAGATFLAVTAVCAVLATRRKPPPNNED